MDKNWNEFINREPRTWKDDFIIQSMSIIMTKEGFTDKTPEEVYDYITRQVLEVKLI